MKKIVNLLLVVCMVFSMGCAGKQDVGEKSEVVDEAETPATQSHLIEIRKVIEDRDLYMSLVHADVDFAGASRKTIKSSYGPGRFSVVDMDSDGEKEVVVEDKCSDIVVFHYEAGEVQYFKFPFRGMKNIKVNGTYESSYSAAVNEIKKLDFNDEMCVETHLCIYDDIDKKYIIDGIDVSPQEAMEYIESNNEKQDVEWYKVNKENLDRLGRVSPSASISTPGVSGESVEGGNHIDEYYLPLIESADSEASLRTLQEEYRKAWEKEFNNITDYLLEKCVYKSDEKQIKEMKRGFRKNVMNLKRVMKTELIDAYQVDPENNSGNEYTRLSLEGNGTRSRLGYLEAQMYRDACVHMSEMCEDYTIGEVHLGEVK